MEKIDSIRIMDVKGGLGGAGNVHANASGTANLAQQAVDAALSYQLSAPILQGLLRQVGITDPRSVEGIMAALGGAAGAVEERAGGGAGSRMPPALPAAAQ